jgi:hypothetical protein
MGFAKRIPNTCSEGLRARLRTTAHQRLAKLRADEVDGTRALADEVASRSHEVLEDGPFVAADVNAGELVAQSEGRDREVPRIPLVRLDLPRSDPEGADEGGGTTRTSCARSWASFATARLSAQDSMAIRLGESFASRLPSSAVRTSFSLMTLPVSLTRHTALRLAPRSMPTCSRSVSFPFGAVPTALSLGRRCDPVAKETDPFAFDGSMRPPPTRRRVRSGQGARFKKSTPSLLIRRIRREGHQPGVVVGDALGGARGSPTQSESCGRLRSLFWVGGTTGSAFARSRGARSVNPWMRGSTTGRCGSTQHRDGSIVVFSDVESFQVQATGTRLRTPGTACDRDQQCWASDEQPVAWWTATGCALVCAGWDGDCESGVCDVDGGPPHWLCSPH